MRPAPVQPPYEPDLERTLARLMGGADAEPLTLFRTIANNPLLLEKFRSVGTYLLNFGTVEPAHREMVILRTCARCSSSYEWGVHAALFADAVGLTDEQVEATVLAATDDPAWSPEQATLVRLVDELHDTARVSDDLAAALARIWTPEQIVELVALVGQYHLISFWTGAFGLADEPWGRPFPAAAATTPR